MIASHTGFFPRDMTKTLRLGLLGLWPGRGMRTGLPVVEVHECLRLCVDITSGELDLCGLAAANLRKPGNWIDLPCHGIVATDTA